jgi:hypothetical protein
LISFFILIDYYFAEAQNKRILLYLGITIAYAYLLKHTFITLWPLGLLGVLFVQYFKKDKNILLSCFLVLGLSLTVYFLWKQTYSNYNFMAAFKPDFTFSIDQLKEFAAARLPSMKVNGHEQYLIFKSELTPTHYFAFFLFFLSFLFFKLRTVLLIFFFIIGYSASLFWMYLTSFPEYEGQILAGLKRYLSLPQFLIFFIAGLTLLRLFTYLPFKKFLERPKSQILLISLGVLLSSFFSYQKVYSQKNNSPLPEVMQQKDAFYRFLKTQKLNQPRVMFISQGGVSFEYATGLYVSIDSHGPLFKVSMDGTSFGPLKDNVWKTLVTAEEMKKRIAAVDAVWMIQSDPWMNQILSEVLNTNNCKPPFEKYFLLKKGDSFECYIK